MYLAWSIYLFWLLLLLGSFVVVAKLKVLKFFAVLILIAGLFSCGIFSYVFILNNGSSVAQLSERKDLWSLWFDFWIPLSFLSLISLVSCLVYFLVRLIKRDNVEQLVYVLVLLGQSALCAYHVISNMPDA
ncbi:hypothetical protein [Saccharospirillum alexandrii]|uniref:hypothetical protein n=1 Tax=Saccharospirillum alexandrii TaxID=2448477 RepID=UPI0037369A27